MLVGEGEIRIPTSESVVRRDSAYDCQPDDFRCRNGKCIPHSWRCDGAYDCNDANLDSNISSDELNCGKGDVAEGCLG